MKVILLENFRKLGAIGDIIEVKRGFARNFLISNKKALFASKQNIKEVEKIKQELSKKDLEKKKHAIEIHEKIKVFLEKLAMKKNKLAILQIAKWYLTLTEEVDYSNAYKWYNVAVAIGIKSASIKRDEMIEELDSEEILKAQQLSNEIFNKINKNGG